MATRSTIAVEQPDRTVRVVYCHWDGYPSWVGKILERRYGDRASATALINRDIAELKLEEEPRYLEDAREVSVYQDAAAYRTSHDPEEFNYFLPYSPFEEKTWTVAPGNFPDADSFTIQEAIEAWG